MPPDHFRFGQACIPKIDQTGVLAYLEESAEPCPKAGLGYLPPAPWALSAKFRRDELGGVHF